MKPPRRVLRRWPMLAVGFAAAMSIPAVVAAAPARYVSRSVIAIPHAPPLIGDIIYADQRTNRLYLSDIGNSALDIIDGRSDRLVKQVSGFTSPAGVLADNLGQVWVGDAAGGVRVVSARAPYRHLALVRLGDDTDELGYDPRQEVIAVTSPSPKHERPFVSLIAARPRRGRYRVLAKIHLPGVPTDSLEQPQWDPAIGRFIESVRTAAGSRRGELAIIDPVAQRLDRVIRLTQPCAPSGLAVGPGDQVLVGCSSRGPAVISVTSGQVLTRFGHRRLASPGSA